MSHITRTYRIFNLVDSSVLLETTSADEAFAAYADLSASDPSVLQVLSSGDWVTITLEALGCLSVW